jgi:hypothetical protein
MRVKVGCIDLCVLSYNVGMKKNPPGAPRKSADKAKAELLQIRINRHEKKAFTDAADLDGKKLSEWVRDRLRRMSRQELETAGLPVAFLPGRK